MMQKTSLTLLDQLRHADDKDAWKRLVNLYTPLLRKWLSKHELLPPEDVDDLVQEVLMAVAKELQQFQHNGQRGAFRKWLRLILVNRLRNFWRGRQKRPEAVGGSDFLKKLDELHDDASGISKQFDDEHDQHVMQHLLSLAQSRFKPHTWQAFRMQVVEGKSPESVADELGLSTSSVYVAKSRIVQALREAAEGLVS